MRGVRHRPSTLHTRLSWLIAIAVCLSVLAPSAALASTDLGAGDTAVIAQANGDNVRLREAPDSSSNVVGKFPEGTSVQITGGVVSDGSIDWYPVEIQGKTGYIAAEYVWPESQAASTDASSADIQTTAWIFNTNGDGIRCRDTASTTGAILHRFVEGDSVTLTGDVVDGWYPAICGSKAGFIAAEFITFTPPTPVPSQNAGGTSTPVPEPAAVTAASSETGADGVVTGTNGDGVRCRTSRSLSASVITVLPEGTTVPLRSEIGGNWTEVTCAQQDGWVATEFLSAPSSSGDDGDSSGASADGSPATITGTNGDGVRCRDKNSFDSNVILVLAENTNITLRGDQNGDWMPVYCSSNNEKGWVFADYVTAGSTSSGGSSSGGSSSGGSSSGGAANGFIKGQTVVVANTNGDGVRLRTAASSSASVVMVLPEGTIAKVRSNGSGDWLAVTYQSYKGFVFADYLELASSDGVGGGQPEPTPAPAPVDGLGDGDHASVTSTLNFRSGASLTSSIIGVANEGDVVLISGSSQNGFYPVQYLEQDGWMGGDYLVWTDAALTAAPAVAGDAGSAPATKQGQAIVDYAMQYLGYPYVWATHGPDTFDCSGFTYWVVLHVLKKDIGAGTWLQVDQGTPVQYGDLKPGDLVFFQNTYTWGLSHVGIYIGNNQFINAENENTGVKISSLSSPYYASRWYGARRLMN